MNTKVSARVSVRSVVEAFGAVPVLDTVAAPSAVCMQCGAYRLPYSDGRAALCLTCTLAELGESEYQLSLRVEFRMTRNAYERRVERDGPAWTNPKAWRTPLTWRKH